MPTVECTGSENVCFWASDNSSAQKQDISDMQWQDFLLVGKHRNDIKNLTLLDKI